MTAVLDAAPSTLPGYGGIDPALLQYPEGRRVLTRCDPALFAAVYLRKHITGRDGRMSLSTFHLDLIEQAKRWMVPAPVGGTRDAYVAPRESGKSTWLFLVLPMWAAAHGHIRFIAAFADSATQAEQHLATFKQELDYNDLLREDYPDLCTPARRSRRSTNQADHKSLMIMKSGLVFSAQGVDTSTLGTKVSSDRPDLIILDDIERDEARYSTESAKKRLGTITDSILPMGITARTVLTGTVTMPNSIIHQLVLSVTTDDTAPWITEHRFIPHYYPAIVPAPDGTERSLWPAKWPLPYLQSIRHTRTYMKNYDNNPMGADGDFWRAEDFTYQDVGATSHVLLSIDPAVTAKKTSDYTGLAVVSWSHVHRCHSVDDALHVKIPPGEKFRQRVLQILADHKRITLIVIETNQGGDTWRAILHDMPVEVETVHQCENKTERATRLLNLYQARPRPRVVHRRQLPALEGEMVSYDHGLNDDILDAVGTGVDFNMARLRAQRKPHTPQVRSESYL